MWLMSQNSKKSKSSDLVWATNKTSFIVSLEVIYIIIFVENGPIFISVLIRLHLLSEQVL